MPPAQPAVEFRFKITFTAATLIYHAPKPLGYTISPKALDLITMPFDGIRKPHLEQVAAALYSDQMPYHNFSHVLRTLVEAELLVERCLKGCVPVNSEVIYFALLFHDAGYHEDHINKGFATKEAYSAHLAVQCLRAEAIPEDTIKRVVAAILSTQRDGQFTTNEEKAVRAADLAGLVGDYKTFRSDVEKLRQEDEMLTGRRAAWDEWKTSTEETIRFYLSQEIRFAPPDGSWDSEAISYARANENLSRFLSEN
jgi:HD superfamily phosphodiesterase